MRPPWWRSSTPATSRVWPRSARCSPRVRTIDAEPVRLGRDDVGSSPASRAATAVTGPTHARRDAAGAAGPRRARRPPRSAVDGRARGAGEGIELAPGREARQAVGDLGADRRGAPGRRGRARPRRPRRRSASTNHDRSPPCSCTPIRRPATPRGQELVEHLGQRVGRRLPRRLDVLAHEHAEVVAAPRATIVACRSSVDARRRPGPRSTPSRATSAARRRWWPRTRRPGRRRARRWRPGPRARRTGALATRGASTTSAPRRCSSAACSAARWSAVTAIVQPARWSTRPGCEVRVASRRMASLRRREARLTPI